MKALWAPWRMTYILNHKEEGCIFCPGENRDQDEARLILYVGTHTMVMMNRYPYNNGHLLVAPVRHIPELNDLNKEEMLDIFLMVRNSTDVIRKLMNPEGFNVGLNLGRVAGAGMERHMHFHIVPRWNGDTNFMTVFGDVRVIPEHIQQTYSQVRPEFDKL